MRSAIIASIASPFVSGLVLGAGAVWLFDPRRGAQRRAVLRDKVMHVGRELEQAARVGEHDLEHRLHGLQAEVAAVTRGTPTDVQLEERVRSELGRVCSHTGGIQIQADGHRVRLEGPALASDIHDLVECVRRVRGVREVDNRLQPIHEPGNVPALQGKHEHRRRARVSPAAHLILGAGSGVFGAAALLRGSVLGLAVGVAGVYANARAILSRNRQRRPASVTRGSAPKPRSDVPAPRGA